MQTSPGATRRSPPPPDDAPAWPGAAAARRILRYLRFVGCPADAIDDVAQDVLVASLARWPAGDAPLPWLLATARNLHRRLLRTRGRRRELVDSERLDAVWRETVPDDAGESMRAALDRCLQQLPERSRAALQLRYGNGDDRAAIAAQFGLGEEGVKSLLARVRAAVAECVRRRLADER